MSKPKLPRLNLIARRGKERARRIKLRATAPRHPVGVEARMRLMAARLMRPVIERLRATYLHRGARHDAPRPRTVARRELKKVVTPIAHDLAKQTHASVAESLGVKASDLPFDLSEQAYAFTDSVASILEGFPVDATKRVAQAFSEWESMGPDGGAGDYDALASLLDETLEGAEGAIQNSLRLLFGSTFADMNRAVQISAGVSEYYWQSRRDNAVRPAHAEMDNVGDGEPYSWDDPPLKADQSSNERDCHPGEDYNCRCVAIPVQVEVASPDDEDVSEST